MANHEEAGTRIVLQCMDYLSNFIVAAARDTNVIILLLAHRHLFSHKSVLVAMGNQLYLNIGTLARNLGPDLCDSLLLCHPITGYDSVFFFYGIGKTKAVKTLLANPGLLKDISHQKHFSDDVGARMELSVCKMYGSKLHHTADAVREHMLLETGINASHIWCTMISTLPTVDTNTSHVKTCKWLTSYVPRSQFQVL